ncbi:MAG: Gfo/Idh/MocA family protein [Bryobacteraceae bacterium]
MNRRSFLQQSTAALALPGARVLGANGDIRVAVAGFRGHGRTHIRNYVKMPGVRIVALCDADRAILDREVANLKKSGIQVDGYVDIRKLLERKDIDAVSTATPNHWHALLTVWACQAGKDVCVEKPVSHNIWEGRKMVEAARKYRRVVQGDLDLRSHPASDQAAAFLRSGALGKVLVVQGFNYKPRPSIGKVPGKGHIPETVDYDLWCGPARKGPIDRAELHYDWHWVWDTGGGEIANNGPHQLDQIRWLLGEPGLPRRAMGLGGRFVHNDAGEVPNTMIALYDYPTAPVIFEVRGLTARRGGKEMDFFTTVTRKGVRLRNVWDGKGSNTGVIFQCEGGYIDVDAEAAFDYGGREIRKFDNAGRVDPQTSFIRAVRSRKIEDIKTDIEAAHLSACLSHAANISYRIGAAAKPGEIREAMSADKDALDSWTRFTEHLAVHGVDLSRTPAVLGPWLAIDARAERFTGTHAAKANALVKREYRKPYVIPEKV